MAAIYLVRHGQASFRSREYDKLSPLGVRQSQVLGEALKQRVPKPDRVIRGSMARHRDTAGECLAAMGLDVEPEVDDRWDEFDHREVLVAHRPAYRSHTLMGVDLARTGNPAKAFQKVFEAALRRWVRAESGYGETWTGFSGRVCAALEDLTSTVESSQTVLVFTSGGPVSAVAAKLLSTGPDVWLTLNRVTVNTGVTTVVYGRRGTSLVSFNAHWHLDSELLTYR
jgi:broad specificity phosphatase PhoE